MKAITFLLISSAAMSGNAFQVRPTTTSAVTSSRRSSSLQQGASKRDTADEGDSRRSFLEKTSAAAVGAVVWSGVADDALGAPERPSARGLAATSIQLIGTAKQPIEVSVLYPKQWTVTKTPGKSISIQDYKYTDRAFSLSRSLPSGKKGVNDLPVSFYTDVLFNLDGPYGNFGKVDDFKVVGAKLEEKGKRTYRYVDLKFSAPTQGLLQVERRACVASTVVGGDVVIFTASVLASRWGKISPIIAEMIESYRADVPQKTPDPSSFAFNRS